MKKAQSLLSLIPKVDTMKKFGRVVRVVGLMIESQGPASSVGDVCVIHLSKDRPDEENYLLAEVVGFREEIVILMPYTHIQEIASGCLVESLHAPLEVKVGIGLLGQVLDPLGHPIDGSPLPKGLTTVRTEQEPPNALMRPPINESLSVGIKAIDGMLTVGNGQRIGIFAGSGVGKSTLLGMIARNTEADINVIALIGERGREVLEFVERDLGPEGLKKTIVVAATSDQPALMRIKGAFTATAIAEYFRDKGKNVMLMMDSVTRVAMAQREVGLAVGEPPATRGYTPSVFAILPKLLERTGTNEHGAITAFYTVLVDGDDMNEPIADAVRGILDGHIVLDRALANRGQYPAINVLKSVSRLMNHIVTPEHRAAAERLRELYFTYEKSEDLINIGAYKRGTSKEIDEAIEYEPIITNFLKQDFMANVASEDTINELIAIASGGQ